MVPELANVPLEEIENNPLLVIKELSDDDTEELADPLLEADTEELADPLLEVDAELKNDSVPDKQDVEELVGILLKTKVPLGLYE